jgi:alkyl hydroperoxide reductase subunit AhpC
MSIPSKLIGNIAPNFNITSVIKDKFKNVSLEDYKGKYLVILFYPLDFTFVCPTELIAFNDSLSQFHDINCEVVTVSTDSKYSHLKWNKTSRSEGGLGGIEIPMIADFEKKMGKDYGVLLTEGPDAGVCLRGLFIIDDKSIIRQMSVNDLPVGRSVDETIRLVQAFQFHDKHGDVCPANWKPGSETMKDDPIKSLSYFKKVNDDVSSEFTNIKTEKDLILEGKSLVLFSAQWCNNCKLVKKNITKNNNINYYLIDVDETPNIGDELDINSLPTMLIYENDIIKKRLVGKEAIEFDYASV